MWGKERQLSFSECERSFVKKPTRRETFLAEMEAVVPFSVLLSLIEPFYSLSDEAVENDLRAPRKIAVPSSERACWPMQTRFTTDFLMVR